MTEPFARSPKDWSSYFWEGQFRTDPLGLSQVPPWLLRTCNCAIEVEHEPDCPDFPIYAAVFAMLGPPAWWYRDYVRWYPMHYICSDGETWHQLGEVNGPTHWCEHEGRVVEEGE